MIPPGNNENKSITCHCEYYLDATLAAYLDNLDECLELVHVQLQVQPVG